MSSLQCFAVIDLQSIAELPAIPQESAVISSCCHLQLPLQGEQANEHPAPRRLLHRRSNGPYQQRSRDVRERKNRWSLASLPATKPDRKNPEQDRCRSHRRLHRLRDRPYRPLHLSSRTPHPHSGIVTGKPHRQTHSRRSLCRNLLQPRTYQADRPRHVATHLVHVPERTRWQTRISRPTSRSTTSVPPTRRTPRSTSTSAFAHRTPRSHLNNLTRRKTRCLLPSPSSSPR